MCKVHKNHAVAGNNRNENNIYTCGGFLEIFEREKGLGTDLVVS